jgi:ferredoxin
VPECLYELALVLNLPSVKHIITKAAFFDIHQPLPVRRRPEGSRRERLVGSGQGAERKVLSSKTSPDGSDFAEECLNSFGEIQLGLSGDMVEEEAKMCLSCGYCCSQSCPYGAPQFAEEVDARMQKCDFCRDKWADNEKPICVEACPTRALDAGTIEELRAKYGQDRDAAGFTWSAKTGPSVVIRPKIQKI